MKKNLFIAALAIGALVSCSENDFVGDTPSPNSNNDVGAISFGSGLRAITRADLTGSDAAAALGNNFVVEGFKWDGGETTKDVVFDHYNVNWGVNTANTTTSNTANWEYVAQTKHDHAAIGEQSIKYWDYAKSQYDFIAYSKGTATAVYTGTPSTTQVKFSTITPNTMSTSAYTIEGKADELAKVYIADLKTAYRPSDYQNAVQFNFRSLAAKVRIGLYETIPGYSVKEVRFYSDATTALLDETDGETGTSNTNTNKQAKLFTSGEGNVFNEAGTYTVYFPTTGADKAPGGEHADLDYNKAHLSFVAAASDGTSNLKTFGALTGTLTTEALASKEKHETDEAVYLGRSSDAAVYAGAFANKYYTTVLPNETGAVLNMKLDYTLLSTDGSGEIIKVTGANAQVPAAYAQWKSGYAYTYLFKISQNTNGLTNPEIDIAGLYPITLDAVVTDTQDGVQETITTVADPSITTYSKGRVVTTNDEYKTGANIYIVVEGTPALTVGTNANLYTVTLVDNDTSDDITTAAQTINEASVANAIAKGGTVTDKNNFIMTVTAASGLTAATEIAAADAPDGKAITVNCAKFTPAAATTTFNEVAQGSLVANTVYYTSNEGDGGTPFTYTNEQSIPTGATNFYTKTVSAGAAGTYVFEYIDGDNKYYKIIKVVD